jgi:hypothetical protein
MALCAFAHPTFVAHAGYLRADPGFHFVQSGLPLHGFVKNRSVSAVSRMVSGSPPRLNQHKMRGKAPCELGDISTSFLVLNPKAGAELFFIDRQAVGANINMQALRLLAILIELITHHRDDDDERADDEVHNVAATHGLISLKSNSEYGQ